jgi:peptidyl-prolyl cis-trans isomerase SurA
MYTGSRGAGTDVVRSRSEAEDTARRLHVLLRTNRADFDALARKYSDDVHTREQDGYIGIFRRGEMTLAFDRTVFALEVGQISAVIETDYGFHIIRREPVRRYHTYHVLIAWQGARKNVARAGRSREEAQHLAEKVRREALQKGADLCRLAQRYSDDPGNRTACGDLGWIEPGMLSPEIEDVIFALQPREISEVIESPYGFHVFWRD